MIMKSLKTINSIEEWKFIPGCSYYQVSNLGRVKSLDKYITFNNNGTLCTILKKGKILKPVLLNQGYLAVSIVFDNKERKLCKIHRLVASAFIPNPNNLPYINHKDEVRTNNRMDNLEWCTPKYNSNYSDTGRKTGAKIINRKDLSRPVEQYDLEGNFIAEYPSINEAQRCTGISETCIINYCRGYYINYSTGKKVNVNHAGGYKWKYKEKV